MKVAVTGATGFIGRHVVAELKRRSVSPILVCRPSSARSSSLSKNVVVQIDLQKPPADAFDVMGRPDVLIHLAWDGLPNYRSPHHFEGELPAQYRFLKPLVESGLRSLVVTGTCYEYGMQSGPLSEASEARPSTAYGFAKDALRRQLEFLIQPTSSSLTWARLFYPFGDGQSPKSLWPQLKRAVEQGAESFDMSEGEQLRDYLTVQDVARHLVSLSLSGGNHGIVNICSGEPRSVRGIVERWVHENNWSIKLNLGCFPYPDHEPMAFWGDPQKLRRVLGDLGRR
jgi:nucleoside-diphosphate-sugar epimerase